MTDQNAGASDANDIIDIEEYLNSGKKPPAGKKYKVKVDEEKIVFHQSVVSREEILTAAGLEPAECYSLYIKMKGCDQELVRPHEKIDLIEKGVEKFVSKPPVVYYYSVDGEPETTDEQQLTPNQILELAGIMPIKDYYLIKVNADGTQVSYKDISDTAIKMVCPAVKYISVFKGETPVS